jgi:DNA-directed RNA polymerase alpha subunit
MLLACAIARAQLFSVPKVLPEPLRRIMVVSRAILFNHRAVSGSAGQDYISEMKAQEKDQILCRPIWQLELSAALKRAASANRIHTMQQLLKYRTDEVQRWPGFNIQLVHEYVSLLESKGLGRLIDCY